MVASFPASSHIDNPYRLNSGEYDSRFSSHAARLFSKTNAVRVRHCDKGYSETLTSELKIQEYLTKFPTFTGTRIILIVQGYSWGKLQITEDGCRTLLSGLGVFSEFMDLLQAFGTKTSSVDETFASRPIFQGEASGSFRLCYLSKHVELNDSEHTKQAVDIYSVRQMGVYHGYDAPNHGHTFVLVNASLTFQQHWLQAYESTPVGMRWMDLHVAVTYAMTYRWREYVNHLEAKFETTQSKSLSVPSHHFAQLSNHTPRTLTGLREAGMRGSDIALTSLSKDPGAEEPDEHVSFADIQGLQVLKDTVLLLDHVLRLNVGVFGGLRDRLPGLAVPGPSLTACSADPKAALADYFVRFLGETAVQAQRVEHLLRRIEGVSTLFRTILDFRALESARYDSQIMLELSQKAHQDGGALKTITLLTLVYLPATFVATLLSMGYIRLTKSKNGYLVPELDEEMWIFTFLTVILLVVTLSYRKFWERRQTQKFEEEKRNGYNA
ncbi:hypothetical protein BZA05DRAFT_174092 [Tricharina praecox]|uniref:uncharacterized protein n=1 Tax=Tricharina praecox TaxID=43433 RepID=UPI00221F927D|nr:uncharacterized protein BZA05DRAFT_174092 [Tricharina praecox]KAI5844326.1 hypothetical protein BZA05DRAFT_174092 [Tricharina praecox]